MFGPRYAIPHRINRQVATIYMRPAETGDAAVLAPLFSQPRVQQYLYLNRGLSVQDETDLLERLRTTDDQIGWVIEVEIGTERHVIGLTSLTRQPGRRYTSFFAIADPGYWGCGIASLTHQLRTWYAFRQLEAHALDSSYFQGNTASGRALRRVGYVRVGRRPRAHLSDGCWHDSILLSCYNPASLPVLWPDDDVPANIRSATKRTTAALAAASRIVHVTESTP